MAATSIVRLSLESNQYEQKLRGARKQFEDFTARIGINMKKMTAYGMAVGVAASAINKLTGDLSECIAQCTELAKAGEGVRIAFDRLNNPGMLDNLRKATHGTVTDLELMKAAVKFNDFKLPVEELGTMLAFAQQKAKDTGQSVDYMVDSIVTGLGRKSLMILDNLGLSANEIKERMKETGDMTKAVGEIIREQMSNAGDYVETAADRATQADVQLKNAMEDLGRTFQPLTDAGTSMFKSLEIGALNLLNNVVKPLINALTAAGRMRSLYNAQSKTSNAQIQEFLGGLANSAMPERQHQINLAYYDKQINSFKQYLADYKTWQKDKTAVGAYDRMQAFTKSTGLSMYSDVQEQMEVLKKQKADYANAAKDILNTKVKIDTTEATQSLDDLKKKLKELQEQRKAAINAGDTDKSKDLLKQINQVKSEIRGLDPNALKTTTTKNTELKKEQHIIEGMLKELRREELKAAQIIKQARAKEHQTETRGLSGFNAQTMGAWMQGRQGDLSKAEYGSASYNSIMANIADMNAIKTILEQSMAAGIDSAKFNLEPLWEKVFDGENIPDSTWQGMVDKINEKLKELNIEPIKIDFNTGGIKTVNDETKKLVKAANTTADVVGSIGDAFNAIEDPAAKVAGTVAQAIATVAAGYAQATLAAAQTGNPWVWVAFAASGLAQMLTMISTIHSATGYAQGGIVKGNSYSGDNIYGGPDAMVNAGELVLTRAQQANLASNLEGSGGGFRDGQIVATIEGETIVLAAKRWKKRTGRSGENVSFKI